MDNFALLDQRRHPWLDLDALKSAFLEISAREHPDRVHTAGEAERIAATSRYADLNAAYNCLRDPKERLAHLITLEQSTPPANVHNVPAHAMDLFARIGQRCREADRILAGKASASSQLAKAQWFVQGVDVTGQLTELQQQINLQREQLLAELRAMNDAWNAAPPVGSTGRASALPLSRLEEIYRVFSYISRWNAQLQDRLGQLAL